MGLHSQKCNKLVTADFHYLMMIITIIFSPLAHFSFDIHSSSFAVSPPPLHVRQYMALLFYIIIWSEQKCVLGNIMKNSQINVCSSFVLILKFYVFRAVMHNSRW